jgi:hypothetical protein
MCSLTDLPRLSTPLLLVSAEYNPAACVPAPAYFQAQLAKVKRDEAQAKRQRKK